LGKRRERKGKSPQRIVKRTRSLARMPTGTRIGIGLPTDPWWEEAFKLGVERVSAEAALGSLEEAKKEGIVGPKVFERLRDVYLEKLSMIEHKQSRWHQEFPTFSEPPARREMMNELSEAVAQPHAVDSTAPAKVTVERETSSQRLTSLGQHATIERKGSGKEFSPLGGPSSTRRAMIDELKSVLSSARPSQARAPVGSVSRRSVAPEGRPIKVPEMPKNFEVPTAKEQILKVDSSPSARVPSKLMELNKEFLAEFRKLRKTDS
jgi:hypothetical protein